MNDAAKAIGQVYFGSATDNPELSDSAYVKQLSNTADFGQITPGNSQKVHSPTRIVRSLFRTLLMLESWIGSGMPQSHREMSSPSLEVTLLPNWLSPMAKSCDATTWSGTASFLAGVCLPLLRIECLSVVNRISSYQRQLQQCDVDFHHEEPHHQPGPALQRAVLRVGRRERG